ncbi:hypothetical protein K435DRAFT_806771 [Dendrothele bispora CBS 962.96]|uniref:Uncharacterized protein n=1 Tax=Dendrothele bispora (strain CBS 962.96) TaxID=1314807 RepID=A0A4S8L6T0_DENBC|nr:hypothetical protein K435DRAFT_806771 [Dendrothele bispora CBS 962.96]
MTSTPMTVNVTLILDSQDLHPRRNNIGSFTETGEPVDPFDVLRLTPNNTSLYISGVFYQDSLLFFNGTNETEYDIDFDGSSISLFGYALGRVSKNFIVDKFSVQPNNLSQNITGGQFPSSPFQGWISGVQQMSIDYALVTATNTSNLEDRTIFVDDDNVEITWAGWTRQANRSYKIPGLMFANTSMQYPSRIVYQPVQALPHGNSVHQSDGTQGDSFVFQFAGNSILVGGFTPGTPDQEPPSADSPTASEAEPPSGALTMIFDVDGNSTFSVSGNISAYIDYITYKPIFNTLIDNPDFPAYNLTPIPGSDSPNLTPIPSSDSPNLNPSGSHDLAAVIAGATIGSLFLITMILIASLWFFKQRQKKQQQLLDIDEDISGYVVEPFTMPVSEANLHLASGSKRTGKNIRSVITTQDVQTHHPVSVPEPMQPDIQDSTFNIILPNSVMSTGESPAVMEARMRGMEAQIELLMSREMQQHIVAPPTYQSEWNF